MEKIIIFGGSFDPIHLGHINLAHMVKEKLGISKCVFLPTYSTRWKNVNTPSLMRLEMVKLALDGENNLIYSDVEVNLKKAVNYTFETIVELKKIYQGDFYLLIGTDQLNQLDRWYKIDELIKISKIVCYYRHGYQVNQDNLSRYHVILIKDKEYDISSTEIRNCQKLYTKKSVLDYIALNDLYYIPSIKKYMSLKRFEHSKSVANLAYDIAKANKLDPYKAYMAGLLHDIARDIDIAKQKAIIQAKYDDYLTYPDFTYHQFVGVEILKNDFHIKDDEVLMAIMFHCTGKKDMSPLGQVIYAADKIEPGRKYDSSSLINACIKDYHQGFIEVLNANRDYLKQFNADNNFLSQECYKFYLKEKGRCNK